MITLTVRVEPKPEHAAISSNAAHSKRLSDGLAYAIKTYVGVSADIVIEPVGRIERSVGKAKRVIDNRPKT